MLWTSVVGVEGMFRDGVMGVVGGACCCFLWVFFSEPFSCGMNHAPPPLGRGGWGSSLKINDISHDFNNSHKSWVGHKTNDISRF